MGSTDVGRSDVAVLPMTEQDWPAVQDTYAAGIATGHATFEASPPNWEHFDAATAPQYRLVAVNTGGRVLGWAAVVAVSDRCVYAGVVEHSVYVAPDARGRGVGRLLLNCLISSTEAAGVWTIQSGIFPENAASLALHAAAGFRTVGVRQRLGRMSHGPMAGQWRDVCCSSAGAPRSKPVAPRDRRPHALGACCPDGRQGRPSVAVGIADRPPRCGRGMFTPEIASRGRNDLRPVSVLLTIPKGSAVGAARSRYACSCSSH